MISIRNLSYSYGREPIFSETGFFLDRHQKAGLVGPNGSGKSTLFRLITGQEMPDEGKIEVTEKIIIVPQEVKRNLEMEAASTIRKYIDPKNKKEDYEF